MAGRDDFYVGYQRRAPAGLAVFLRRTVVALVLLGALVAAALAALQEPFEPGVFEYGVERQLRGVIRELPYPQLLVTPPSGGQPSSFHLVAFGKAGAAAEIAGLDGSWVELRGSLIHRQGETMVEVVAGSMETIEGAPPTQPTAAADLGLQTLRGEIVDSKCFLGVMKPGRGKPHRACATLCIRGGIQPVLRVETAGGEFRHFLLVDESGAAVNDRLLDLVAEPVEISGRVVATGELLVLQADPASYRRLASSG